MSVRTASDRDAERAAGGHEHLGIGGREFSGIMFTPFLRSREQSPELIFTIVGKGLNGGGA